MNFDLLFMINGPLMPSAPKLPSLPPAPAPLPLITNQGGAAGLQGEDDASKKTKLGGN